MSVIQQERLRPHPDERFAATQHRIDVNAAFARLVAEPKAAGHGHRQETLYRHGRMTLAAFLFEQDARLEDHVVDGVVVIQTMEGLFTVQAEGQAHTLGPGQLLVLAPGVRHTLVAAEPSKMLLTVNLE